MDHVFDLDPMQQALAAIDPVEDAIYTAISMSMAAMFDISGVMERIARRIDPGLPMTYDLASERVAVLKTIAGFLGVPAYSAYTKPVLCAIIDAITKGKPTHVPLAVWVRALLYRRAVRYWHANPRTDLDKAIACVYDAWIDVNRGIAYGIRTRDRRAKMLRKGLSREIATIDIERAMQTKYARAYVSKGDHGLFVAQRAAVKQLKLEDALEREGLTMAQAALEWPQFVRGWSGISLEVIMARTRQDLSTLQSRGPTLYDTLLQWNLDFVFRMPASNGRSEERHHARPRSVPRPPTDLESRAVYAVWPFLTAI